MKINKRNNPDNDHWKTPDSLYKELDKEFNFDFDPCPLRHNIKKWDGLKVEWGKVNFVNPPYSYPLKDLFIRKAFEEWKKGKTVILLIPNNTETIIFHELILPNAEIRFIKGRVKFEGYNSKGEYVTNKTGLTGSMICILRPNKGKMNKIKLLIWFITILVSYTIGYVIGTYWSILN